MQRRGYLVFIQHFLNLFLQNRNIFFDNIPCYFDINFEICMDDSIPHSNDLTPRNAGMFF
jgi:hypothetical protein